MINFEIRPILWAMIRSKTAPLLVAIQVAISLALLVNALYVVKLRLESAARPSGIAEEADIFTATFPRRPPRDASEANAQFALRQQEIAAIRAISGVASAAMTNQSPLAHRGGNMAVSIDPKQDNPTAFVASYRSPDSLIQTWGLRLVEGRDFNPNEIVEPDIHGDGNPVGALPSFIIITHTLAKKLFPSDDKVVGKTVYFGRGGFTKEVRISGVVERLQTHHAEPDSSGEYSMLMPVRFTNIGSFPYVSYTVRTQPGQRDRVMKEVEAMLVKMSPTPLVVRTRTMEEDRTNRYRAEKALAWMLIAVSALLIIVTASGIVGMSTLWVSQRRKQIGVRRALGARRLDILRYFITENLFITTGGIITGIVLALALNQFLVSRFELTKLPLLYVVVAPLVFWALGVIAVFAPAWRAAGISPAIATRST